MTIQFEAHPIETAPKDREIYLFADGRWRIGYWIGQQYLKNPKPYWNYRSSLGIIYMRANPPTHWAEIPGPERIQEVKE